MVTGQHAPPWIRPFYSETCIFANASAYTHFEALINLSSHYQQKHLSSSPMFAVDSRLSGNLGLAWISATLAVGDRGAVKGDPPGAYPLAYTHLSVQDTTSLPGSVSSGVWRLQASAFLSLPCVIT